MKFEKDTLYFYTNERVQLNPESMETKLLLD